ncbi:acetoacetate decarboxylase family protein [Streptomyces sp. Ac-502]|uniref:acetoacetate decarboxylase family protein n=1 Tax=Streptomyces sp. Ac-502 TaxID=3342801 RepID=UPI003862D19A
MRAAYASVHRNHSSSSADGVPPSARARTALQNARGGGAASRPPLLRPALPPVVGHREQHPHTPHTHTGPGDAGPVGYSLPLSPTGASSMLTPPPWHFSGEVVMVEYRVDPDAARRFLPPGLTPGADPGAAAAVFATWQWCSADGAELADPGRCQFGGS